MPIITALLVAGAASYAAQKGNEGSGKDGGTGDDNVSRGANITSKFLENKMSVDLLPLERALTIMEWPIKTVSFYKCTSSEDDVDGMIDKLERRVGAVLRANPWLGGWLVRGKGIGSFDLDNAPRLWYDPTGEEMAPGTFKRFGHDNVPLDKDTPYESYESIMREAVTVKINDEIVGRKEEPLFRVAVVPSSDELALVVSMSHICGDAHTFYRLYNMVVGNGPISSMTPKRPWIYNQKVMKKMGREEARYVADITTDPAWMKLFRLGSSNVKEDEGSKLRGRAFFIDKVWITNMKASRMVNGGVELSHKPNIFASTLRSPMTPASLKELEGDDADANATHSTNDILVAFFWTLLNPDVGLMAVNFRGRLEGDGGEGSDAITRDHAGNYANPIPYTKADYGSPALIRKSLESCRRAGATEVGHRDSATQTTLPRPHPDLTFSVVTNWSSFLRGKEEERKGEDDDGATNWRGDARLVRHLPVVYPRRMMEKMPRRMSFLVIFSSGTGDVGCVLIAPGHAMEEIDACGVVGEPIAEF